MKEKSELEAQFLKLAPSTLSLCKISSEMMTLESIDKMCETLEGYKKYYDFGSKSVSGIVEDVNTYRDHLKLVCSFFFIYFFSFTTTFNF